MQSQPSKKLYGDKESFSVLTVQISEINLITASMDFSFVLRVIRKFVFHGLYDKGLSAHLLDTARA